MAAIEQPWAFSCRAGAMRISPEIRNNGAQQRAKAFCGRNERRGPANSRLFGSRLFTSAPDHSRLFLRTEAEFFVEGRTACAQPE